MRALNYHRLRWYISNATKQQGSKVLRKSRHLGFHMIVLWYDLVIQIKVLGEGGASPYQYTYVQMVVCQQAPLLVNPRQRCSTYYLQILLKLKNILLMM